MYQPFCRENARIFPAIIYRSPRRGLAQTGIHLNVAKCVAALGGPILKVGGAGTVGGIPPPLSSRGGAAQIVATWAHLSRKLYLAGEGGSRHTGLQI